MKNPFSSPRATRLLLAACSWLSFALLFAVYLLWADKAPNDPRLINRLIVVTLFGSIMLWCGAYPNLKAWLIEYRYGLRLEKATSLQGAIDKKSNVNELQFLPLTSNLSVPNDRHQELEKLRYPWPSLVCSFLLLVILFQWSQNLQGNQFPMTIPIFVAVTQLFVSRPSTRWGNYRVEIDDSKPTAEKEKPLSMLNRYLTRVDGSNFYRFHKKRLQEQGFRLLRKQRHRHFLTSPTGDVVAILGREYPLDRFPKDYLSLISIDDQGCIFESCTLDRPHLRKWADCHDLWRFQTLDTVKVVEALMHHQKWATLDSGRQFVVANEGSVCAKYFHAVTANAKIRYFNAHRIAFA